MRLYRYNFGLPPQNGIEFENIRDGSMGTAVLSDGSRIKFELSPQGRAYVFKVFNFYQWLTSGQFEHDQNLAP